MHTESHDPEVLQIAGEIETYLRRRPGSGDTLEGIIGFWLPRVRLEAAADKVLQALHYLEKANVVIKEPLVVRRQPGAHSGGKYNPDDFYRLNPQREVAGAIRPQRV